MNANFTDVATALSSALVRDGQAPMTGALRLDDGSLALPGLSFANDTNTGLYRSASDAMRAVTGGAAAMLWDAAQKTWVLSAFDVAGPANFQAALTGITAALAASGAAPLTLRRSEDTTDEREVISIGVGDGSGDKASDRIVGDGSDDVVERRRYIGSTEIERFTTSLALVNILFGVGTNLRLHPDGYADLAEISAPTAPSANILRAFVMDVGGDTKLAIRDSAGDIDILGPGEIVAIIEDRKNQNTAAQTLSSGSDQVRDLNSLAYNRGSLVSLSSNRFTLPAGTWLIKWRAPTSSPGNATVEQHQSLLYNQTDSSEVARGSSQHNRMEGGSGVTLTSGGSVSEGSAVVTIADSKAFEIRHRVAVTGLGGARANFGTEVYTRVEVYRA